MVELVLSCSKRACNLGDVLEYEEYGENRFRAKVRVTDEDVIKQVGAMSADYYGAGGIIMPFTRGIGGYDDDIIFSNCSLELKKGESKKK